MWKGCGKLHGSHGLDTFRGRAFHIRPPPHWEQADLMSLPWSPEPGHSSHGQEQTLLCFNLASSKPMPIPRLSSETKLPWREANHEDPVCWQRDGHLHGQTSPPAGLALQQDTNCRLATSSCSICVLAAGICATHGAGSQGKEGLSCSRAAVINISTKLGSIGLCLRVPEAPMYPYRASKVRCQGRGWRCCPRHGARGGEGAHGSPPAPATQLLPEVQRLGHPQPGLRLPSSHVDALSQD